MPVPFDDLDAWLDACENEKDMEYEEIRADMPTDMLFTFLLKCWRLGTRPPTKSQRADLIKLNPPVMTLLLLIISQRCGELSQDCILTNNLVRSFVGFVIYHSQTQYLNVKEYVENADPMIVLDFMDGCMKLGSCAVNTVCFLIYQLCENREIKAFCVDLVDPASIRWSKFYTNSLMSYAKILPLVQDKTSTVSPEHWANMIAEIKKHVEGLNRQSVTALIDCAFHTFRFAHCTRDPMQFVQIVYNNAPQEFKVIMWGILNSGSYMTTTPLSSIDPTKIKMWKPAWTNPNMALLTLCSSVYSDFEAGIKLGKYTPALLKKMDRAGRDTMAKYTMKAIMSSTMAPSVQADRIKELKQALADANESSN